MIKTLQTQTPYLSANYFHLRRLFVLRNLFVLAQCLAFFIAELFLQVNLNSLPILLEISCLVIFNAFVWKHLRLKSEVSNNEIFTNLIVDIVALTALLYFTGGASNPFITLFIFPLIISVTVLPARFAWVVAAVTICSYSFLMFQYAPIEMNHADHNTEEDFNLHIIGMWMAFTLSAGLVAHSVAKMGSTIRSQDELLVKAKEDALRDRQIIELGTLAASTAHELGTPLGAMNLLVREIKSELKNIPDQVNNDLDSLKQQIDRCKDALSNLSTSADAINVISGSVSTVTDYLENTLQEWQSVRLGVPLKKDWKGTHDGAKILDDRTLTQAIINILDNAADVSPANVEWGAVWNEREIIMEIRDRGNGLAENIEKKIGKSSVSDQGNREKSNREKDKGLGLGLFLSHAIIERFGGTVSLINRKNGGMITRITVPLLEKI